MEIRHLALFCLIKEYKSISKAARVALLSQPTVSQHLKTLENELGMTLFDRNGRQMIPTREGEVLYGYAKQVMDLIEKAKHALDEHLGAVRGDLCIAGSTIPGQYILPSLIGAFCRAHPEVVPRLHVGDSRWAAEKVFNDEVELAFVGAPQERPGLAFRPFAKDELILIASPLHPIVRKGELDLKDLPSVPLISREPGSGTRSNWENILKQAGVNPNALKVIGELGSTEAVVRCVKTGIGAAIVSLLAVDEELERGTLARITLEGCSLERIFYVVQRPGRTLSPVARAFEAFVQESLPGVH